MRKVLLTIIATAAVVSFAASADARYRTKEVDERGGKCYLVEYVPSLYKLNTRGKLVSTESRSWSGDIADGAIIRKVRNPAVYVQTQHLIEKDHYTLIPQGSC